LLRYKAGQHDLICEATGTGKDYLDDGCTAYEAVCILQLKLEYAKHYLKDRKDKNAIATLALLDAHQDSEDFSFIPMYGAGDSSANKVITHSHEV
jgi:hypothetical protein